MKRIIGLLMVLALVGLTQTARAQIAPNVQQDPCLYSGNKLTVTKSISTATTTALVAAPGATQSIYICSAQIAHPGGTGTMALEYGTGTACATAPILIRAAFAYNTTAGTPTLDNLGDLGQQLAGNGVCALSTGTIVQVVTLTYVTTGPM
jgi:hypothetical protein